MSEEEKSADEPKPQIGGELIIPVSALVLTIYYFSTIMNSPWTAQVNAFMVGSILIAVVLVFLVSRLGRVFAGRATLGAADVLAPRGILPKRAAFAALCLLYLVAIEWLGFTLTTFVFLWLAMMLLDGFRRPVLFAAIAGVTALVGYIVFIAAFETRLPAGVVERAFAGMI